MTFLAALFATTCWFVDGFHGGMYGHYPRETYTGFICDQLDRHPDWNIGLEIEPATWDVVADLAPKDLARLQDYAKTPRVEFTNPTYAQPYLWNISGESILRQFELGFKELRKHFPDAEVVTYACEEPCFTSALPAILKSFGFKYAVLRCPNTCWGGYPAAFGGERVTMVGPDGTKMPAVPRPACEALQPGSVWQTTSWGNGNAYLAACREAGIAHPVGMTYQDAGWTGGPWGGEDHMKKKDVRYVTWRQYFEEVADTSAAVDWKFSQEDVRPNLMWGSTVMNVIGREVRAAENRLVQAEKAASLACIAAFRPPHADSLEDGWRTLCLAQHHDSWIVPYNGLHKKDKTWAMWIDEWTGNSLARAESEIDASLAALAATLPASAAPRLLVCNTQGHARREYVTFPASAAGAAFLFPADVPSFGYRAYTRTAALAAAQGQAVCTARKGADGRLTVSNGTLELVFDPSRGGAIVHVKTADGETFAGDGASFAADAMPTDANCLFGELRGHFYKRNRWRSSCEQPAVCTVAGADTPRLAVTVRGEIAGSPFTQIYTLTANDPTVACSLHVDWNKNPGIGEFAHAGRRREESRRGFADDRYKLNVLFPSVVRNGRLFKDAPFDVCASRLDHTWFGDWRAIRHNIVLNWVDLTDAASNRGLAVFTDHTGSYSFGPNFPLALTAQYSGGGLWGRDYTITAPLDMQFAFRPHRGAWDKADVERTSRMRAEPLLTRLVAPGAPAGKGAACESFLSLDGTGFELSALRWAGNRDFEVRLYNAAGDDAKQTFTFADRLESLALPRFGFRTLRLTAPSAVCRLETIEPATGAREVKKTFLRKIEAPNWTKDGAAFIYNADGRLWRLPAEGGCATLLDTGFCTRCNNDHVLSADGKSVAVSNDRHGGSQVFILPLDGGVEPRQVTAKKPSYLHGWSPDGRELVYCAMRDADPRGDVYAISADGGEEVRLTDAPGLDDGPEYSPDGKHIWFCSVRSGLMQVWRMKRDGSEQTQMTHETERNCWFPHVSPDGQWVVFLAYRKGDLQPGEHLPGKQVELMLMPAAGGENRVLAKLFGGQGTINVNSWSPDSKRLAFVSYEEIR